MPHRQILGSHAGKHAPDGGRVRIHIGMVGAKPPGFHERLDRDIEETGAGAVGLEGLLHDGGEMFIHQNTMWVPVELADEGIGLIKGQGAVYFIEDAVYLAGKDRAVGGVIGDMPGSALGVA